ncbi:MAG: alpha-amylase family glycosyl hydrolase [Anaeromyxobacter sp.]
MASLAPPAGPAVAAEPAGPVTQWQHDWARGAVFYEVFVRSFADSDGDGIGDLRGLTSRLDALNDGDPATTQDLGVDALWLMPIFPSPSYHGYDATDYLSIHRQYGTLADFDQLLKEAHRRGIRVILDLALNHTSTAHPWFRESASSRTSPRRGWYVWRDQDPGWTQPWGEREPTWHEAGGAYYYGLPNAQLPDLDLRNPEVRAEARRIARFWLERGVDGFRLDYARYMIEDGDGAGQCDTPATHALWTEFSAYVRSVKPEALLVGEVWTDAGRIAGYYGDTSRVKGGDQLPMTFDFPLSGAIVAGLRAGVPDQIADALDTAARLYPAGVLDAPFLTNHDQVRIATELGGDAAKLRAAAAILLTLPGAPFIYYGEELGMLNGPGTDDAEKRTPLPWDGSKGGGFSSGRPWMPFAPGREVANVAAEQSDPRSLRSRYRELIALRHRSEALREGGLELLPCPGTTLAFVRRSAHQTVLVLQNVGDEVEMAGPYRLPEGTATVLFSDPGVGEPVRKPEGTAVRLPPHATAIFELGEANPR